MLSHKFDLRSIVGMALCALLSLVAFLTFLILMAYSNRFMAILGLTASLVCPTVWLMVLLSNDGGGGGGLVQWLYDFVERVQRMNIHVPIIPGILPILNTAQVKRFVSASVQAIFQNLGLTSQAVGQEITLPRERELVAGSASLAL